MSDKLIRDDVDKFFDYGIDIGGKTLYMGSAHRLDDDDESGTDFIMAERVIKGLHLLDKRVTNGLTIIMNNPGGDVQHGMAIFDAIKTCQNHVTIRAIGYAMSMGAVILQAADERIMTPNSKFMFHYGEISYSGHPKDVQAWVKEDEKFNTWMLDLFYKRIKEKHPRYNKRKLHELFMRDTILDAKTAVNLGLVDKVLEE